MQQSSKTSITNEEATLVIVARRRRHYYERRMSLGDNCDRSSLSSKQRTRAHQMDQSVPHDRLIAMEDSDSSQMIPTIADSCSTTATSTSTFTSHHITSRRFTTTSTTSSIVTCKRRPRQQINRMKPISYAKHCLARLALGQQLLLSLCCLLIISVPTLSQGSHHHHNQQQQQQPFAATSSSSETIQSVLLDTTEQSSLGWTRYPDGGPGGQGRTPGWSEETFLQVERDINWRSFVTCDVAYNSVNNWLWTPYIERGDAQRLYIEIKFTMRDCNLFPQMVLSCKETFALLYKEVDGPLHSGSQAGTSGAANVSFAQSDSFSLIDAIAADEGRFTSNSDVVINTEIRSVPVSKRGLYFAFRDQGACLSLIAIKVYSLKCPAQVANLARFNATHTGRDLTSLVAVDGECVPNSIQVEPPRMFCSADGQWNQMSSGQCKCLAGYEPAANQTKCQACPPGSFKAAPGDSPCLPCPERSFSTHAGATECKCQEGFYRAPKDSRSMACTAPPAGPPQNLTVTYVDSTSLVLQWQPPARGAGQLAQQRDDLTYKLLCDSCDFTTLVSSPQFSTNFSETKCVLSGLQPATSYRFTLYVMNGVSLQANYQAGQGQQHELAQQFSEITVQTSRPAVQTTANTLSSQGGGFQLLPVYNFRALPGARGSDVLLAWEAAAAQPPSDLLLMGPEASSEQQREPSLYEIKFVPRFPQQPPVDLTRRSPYPFVFEQQPQQQQQLIAQPVTTTNKAVAIYSLQPRTEYAFQLRAKWAHSSQWTDWSEPIYATTGAQTARSDLYAPSSLVAPFSPLDTPSPLSDNQINSPIEFDPRRSWPPGLQTIQPRQPNQQLSPASSTSWFGSLVLILFSSLLVSILLVLTLVHYRNSICLKSLSSSLSGGLMGSNVGSTYAGVYNGGTTSDLIAGVTSSPLAAHHQNGGHYGQAGGLIYHNTGAPMLHNHLHTTLSAGSGGALITGSNSTSRSSSGAGGVVQSFLAATLGQLAGHNNHQQHNQHGHLPAKTLHHLQEGKLFAGVNAHNSSLHHLQQQQQHQQQALHDHQQEQRPNHYHQMLGNVNHTLLFSGGNGNNHNNHHHHQQHSGPFQQQPPTVPLVPPPAQTGQAPQQVANIDLFGGGGGGPQQQSKYGNSRTLSGQQHQYGLANLHDPQMHIYDDLEVVSQSRQSLNCSPANGQVTAATAATPPSLMAHNGAINGQHQQQQQQQQHARELHMNHNHLQHQHQQHQHRQAIYASTRELFEPSSANSLASKFVINQQQQNNGQQQQQHQQPKRASAAAAKFYKERGEDEFYDE